MAHFLVFATDENDEPRFRSRLIEMLKLLRGGMPSERAFTSAFSDNIEGFQQRFVEYARELEASREATWIENQIVLADMLTSLKSEGRTFDDVGSFRETIERHGYRLQYSRGPLQWSTADDPKVYFTDALGRDMQGDQLFFLHRRGAPLPDLVCRPIKGLQFHTRFYAAGERIEYEVLIENW